MGVTYSLVFSVSGSRFPSGVFKDERVLDEVVQFVQVNVAEDRGRYAPNAVGNFCFDVTLGYRRVERGR